MKKRHASSVPRQASRARVWHWELSCLGRGVCFFAFKKIKKTPVVRGWGKGAFFFGDFFLGKTRRCAVRGRGRASFWGGFFFFFALKRHWLGRFFLVIYHADSGKKKFFFAVFHRQRRKKPQPFYRRRRFFFYRRRRFFFFYPFLPPEAKKKLGPFSNPTL